ncbi:MAG: SPFH domain-containing protein [Methylobacteriaceae bacterium]|jgi:regulator of protease activity HflC (stomatin/prohibitin superfamily)|nr:SPFH domain-containing protein [Methylobacteriaceae bacterium]
MFGFRYIKASPTTWISHMKNGRVVRHGPGLAFHYYAPYSSLIAVPMESRVVPFAFHALTADFQTVTVQGALSYRIADPEKIASMLDFSISPSSMPGFSERCDQNGEKQRGVRFYEYQSDDPANLRGRIEAIVEVLVNQAVNVEPLTRAVAATEAIASIIDDQLQQHSELTALGLEILSFSLTAIRPTPETARALEAESREQILLKADEAIYARRNASVANERAIKESELDTEIALELKQRSIRESKLETEVMAARKHAQVEAEKMEQIIALEDRRQELVTLETENSRKSSEEHIKQMKAQAEIDVYRLQATFAAFAGLDANVVQALALSGMDPAQLMARAFDHLAENADKIGQFNIGPDLLDSLLGRVTGKTGAEKNGQVTLNADVLKSLTPGARPAQH